MLNEAFAEGVKNSGLNYGHNYILFKAPAVEAYHNGDDELQVVFDASEWKVGIPVEQDTITLESILRIYAPRKKADKELRDVFEAAFASAVEELGDDPDDLEYYCSNPVDAVRFIERVFLRAGQKDLIEVLEGE